ncbi:MAG: hypothetical protein LUC93_15875 [Planctomycetaceae bacterium]|nr:hypothetical protein [Planctomycetaceae bacterium]
MYSNSILSASAKWEFSTSQTTSGTGEGGDAFSKLFESIRGGAQSGLDAILDKLGERFPSVSFNGKPAAASEGAAAEEAAEETKDTVEVDESALAEMTASDRFAQLVEKAISSFMDATSKIQPPTGTSSIRSISISVNISTFSYGQVDNASGDKFMSQELQTSLKDKIDEMINKFFGVGTEPKAEEPVAEEEAAAGEAAETTPTANNGKYNFMTPWSMNMSYSMDFFSGSWNNDSASGQGFMMQSQFSAQISAMLGASGGNMADLSQNFLGMGMNMSSFQQSSSGMSFRLEQSRNLMNELMELLQNRQPPVIEPKATEEETEDVAAEAAEEVAATVED